MEPFDALKREAMALERQMEDKVHRIQQVRERVFYVISNGHHSLHWLVACFVGRSDCTHRLMNCHDDDGTPATPVRWPSAIPPTR
jgi:hypothetical protein